MHELSLEDVSLNINEVQIASKVSMRIQGVCALQISSEACVPREILLLFTKTHMYATNQIKVEGNAYFDGKVLPACKMHHLLNHGIIFEGSYSVRDVLVMLNRSEAEHLIEELGMTFLHKRVDHLSIQESSIFEIAVNLATKARIIFIRSFGVSSRTRKTCLKTLKKYASSREVVFLVETEYSEIFDSAVCISRNGIVSLDKSDCEIFFRRQQLSVFNIEPVCGEKAVFQKIVTRCEGAYDYKRLFKDYKTENLVDLKHRNVSFFGRLLTYDFYRINPMHAFRTGFRKYEITFQRPDHRASLAKSIGPCILFILCTRAFQEIRKSDWVGHLPNLLAYLLILFSNPKRGFAPFVLYFIKNLYIQECTTARILSMSRNVFRGEYSVLECRFISVPVSLCVFYQYSSIFEEDFQVLNYYMNIMMTPGTYIMSIFVYMLFAHMITFCILGYLFNVNHMVINVLCSFFTNLVYCPFLGTRLRSSIIAFHLATLMAGMLQDTKKSSLGYLFKLLRAIFPSTMLVDLCKDTGISFQALYRLICYCVVSYVICCCKISSR